MIRMLALSVYLGITSPAQAALPVSCAVVRAYVGQFGLARCITWARARGWSEAHIREARQCLRR
jgi:hypothetical protein